MARSRYLLKLIGLPLCGLLWCQNAAANGRFPTASQLLVDVSDPNHIVVGATYGMLASFDAGQHWSFICEAGYGSSSTEDAAVAVMSGTVLAGVKKGLSVAQDGRGCSFAFAAGSLQGVSVIDEAIEKNSPSHAVAVASTPVEVDGAFSFENALSESLDNGKSWQHAGDPLPDDLAVLTVDVAPSDPQRVYVSGISVASAQDGIIERSDQRGAGWVRLSMPESPSGSLPFIAAVDPHDENVLYVRVTHQIEELFVSSDGAKTWKSIYVATSPILGFALAPDGSKVAVASKAGIAVADTADYAFQRVSAVAATCLNWSAAGIYACAAESTEGFSIGLSTDDAHSFQPLYHLYDACSLDCPASSATTEQCSSAACDAGSDAGSLPDGGAAGSGTMPPRAKGSCSCSAAGGSRGRRGGLWLAVALALTCSCTRRRSRAQSQRARPRPTATMAGSRASRR
jgi:hypothetical protein